MWDSPNGLNFLRAIDRHPLHISCIYLRYRSSTLPPTPRATSTTAARCRRTSLHRRGDRVISHGRRRWPTNYRSRSFIRQVFPVTHRIDACTPSTCVAPASVTTAAQCSPVATFHAVRRRSSSQLAAAVIRPSSNARPAARPGRREKAADRLAASIGALVAQVVFLTQPRRGSAMCLQRNGFCRCI